MDAAVEVLDHLQSHLERQALLENVEEGADSMRINRWPQWGAVAAMLLLTVGLGALVFAMLPGGAFNHETVAIAPPSMQNLPSAPSLDAKDESPEKRDAVASAATRRESDADAFLGKSGEPRLPADASDTVRSSKQSDDLTAKPSEFSKGGGGPLPPATPDLALNNGSAIVSTPSAFAIARTSVVLPAPRSPVRNTTHSPGM